MPEQGLAKRVLILNTVAFTVCFAVWTMYGVLGAFLSDAHLLKIDKAQLGWLIGAPILTGSLMRLPVGLLTDRYGGKPVYITVMLIAAGGVALTSLATEFWHFLACGLIFGMAGAAFAVGIAYTSVFWPKERQGTALGIFGVGNAGSAVTTLLAPTALQRLTQGGANPEGWRQLPLLYAGALLLMTAIFALMTTNRRPENAGQKTLVSMLRPLRSARVWRFGAYYFLVFGAFVALAQWLVPYYLSVYGMSLAMAGLMASIFSLPSGLISALGGWASDKFGARATMYLMLSQTSDAVGLASSRTPGRVVRRLNSGIRTSVGSNFCLQTWDS
ncbi:MAG: MFS transporter [Methanoregulaceae archaeon]|nr:MFS transporter [Methanoregulaceae archaeon]